MLEVRGEGAEPTGVQERPQADLLPGRVPQRVVSLTAGPQLGGDPEGVVVLLDQIVDLRVGDLVDHPDQVVDPVGVDRDAEAQFGLDLVPSVTATSRMLSPKRARRSDRMADQPIAARVQAPTRCATRGSLTCPATVLRATPSRV